MEHGIFSDAFARAEMPVRQFPIPDRTTESGHSDRLAAQEVRSGILAFKSSVCGRVQRSLPRKEAEFCGGHKPHQMAWSTGQQPTAHGCLDSGAGPHGP